jgi:hypothetical protein
LLIVVPGLPKVSPVGEVNIAGDLPLLIFFSVIDAASVALDCDTTAVVGVGTGVGAGVGTLLTTPKFCASPVAIPPSPDVTDETAFTAPPILIT